VLLMIVIGVVVFAVAVAVVWFVLTRGSTVSETTKKDFDDAYDELVAEGDAEPGDRDAAWRDFHNWQVQEEEERLEREESGDE